LKLYLKLKQYKQATNIAIGISSKELDDGNIKNAHKVLFETIQKIISNNEKVPFELTNKLSIIHGYIQVRNIIKYGDHTVAALNLIRICKNISNFSQQSSNILTTTVVECTKAKMKQEAYKWASFAIKPE